MWNGYPPYRRSGIRFFPHIFPIAFPLIFFIVRLVMLGSPQAAWDSMRNTGNQWQQRFMSQRQTPYYQPSTPPETPYYQPTQQTNQPQQPYGQGYQAGEQTPYYQPTTPPETPYYQPKANKPEEMPPIEQ